MTFDEWFYKPGRYHIDSSREIAKQAWDAATEEVKKDHFKIGEEVEARVFGLGKWERCTIRAANGLISVDRYDDVRRIPAWEPKDGEWVIFPWFNDENVRTWHAGTYKAGRIYFADDSRVAAVKYCKPFDPDKIGKPWDEV